MQTTCYDPPGIEFYDAATGRYAKLVTEGGWSGWLVFRHPEGHWVTWRRATADDRARLDQAHADSVLRTPYLLLPTPAAQ